MTSPTRVEFAELQGRVAELFLWKANVNSPTREEFSKLQAQVSGLEAKVTKIVHVKDDVTVQLSAQVSAR